MMLHTIRIYMFTYICWRIVTVSIKKGNVEFTLSENLYLRVSDACRALADLRITTDDDVSELQNTVSVLHFEGTMVTWYPINKYIVPLKDIVIKKFLIIEPLGRDDINSNSTFNESTNGTNDDVFIWVPINESFVQLDDSMNKWVPIYESIFRNRRDNLSIEWQTVNESFLQLDDNIFRWFPLNDTLVQLDDNITNYIRNQTNELQNDNMIKWYPINDSLVRLDDKTISWQKIDESLMDPQERTKHRHLKDIIQVDDVTTNWYSVNESHVALKRPDINVTRGTKLIIHGFGAGAMDEVTFDIAAAYNKQKVFNVLLIDAEVILSKLYFKCVGNARLLGKAIADLIIHLESFGANAIDFHLLGVSLGAHVAGWAGKYFRHSQGRRIGRITGLDPAGPCFTYVPTGERLDKTDALYVDVIHTNLLMQGMFEPLGHADFYLNGGGPIQPGCYLPACSHLTAAFVYTESIKLPDLFMAVRCVSWMQFQEGQCRNNIAFLGHGSSPDSRGLFYLRTSPTRPYGLGIDGIKPEEE